MMATTILLRNTGLTIIEMGDHGPRLMMLNDARHPPPATRNPIKTQRAFIHQAVSLSDG
jgi:hypothetical protein